MVTREQLLRTSDNSAFGVVFGLTACVIAFIALAATAILTGLWPLLIPGVILPVGGAIALILFGKKQKERTLIYKETLERIGVDNLVNEINGGKVTKPAPKLPLFITEKHVVYAGKVILEKTNVKNVSVSRNRSTLIIYFYDREGRSFRCAGGSGLGVKTAKLREEIVKAINT